MEILEIAKYEFMLLRRTIRFKLAILLYAVVIVLLNLLIAQRDLIGRSPMITTLSGFSPYVSAFFFSFISAFIIPFIVGNFLTDDKKTRVKEVIYSKSISNLKYITGKFIGSNLALITICVIVMFLSSVIQISIAVRPYKLYPYITSFLLICLPTVIFFTGVVYALNFIIKNRFLVFLTAVGISFLSIFIIGEKVFRLFDFAAIILPLNMSDIMGYGNINHEIMQRIAYIFFGLSLVFLSAVFPFRLPGIKFSGLKMMIIFITIALIPIFLFIIIINDNSKNKQLRINILEAHEKYSEIPPINVAHYDMDISLFPSKQKLKAESKMNISYPDSTNLEQLIFVLNSGLKITKLTDENGNNIPYTREYSIVAVDAKNNLPEVINISYEGSINENSFYLLDEIKEKIYFEFSSFRIPQLRWNVGESFSWIREGSTLLIPESRWYPVPGADYRENTRIPKLVNFSTANISVTVPEKYKVITQGSLINTSNEDNKAIYTYKTDIPVPQFSINAGDYIVKYTRVDSIDFYAYYYPQHKRHAEFFADTSNVIDETIKELKDWIETETTLKYPYNSFSLIEVPLDFRTYFETYEDFNPMVQPGIVMIPENNIGLLSTRYTLGFDYNKNQATKTGEEFNISDRKKFYFKRYIASNLANSGKFGGKQGTDFDWGTYFLNIITEYWGFQIGSKDRLSSLIRNGINRQIPQFLGAEDDEIFAINKNTLFEAMERKPLIKFSPEVDGILYKSVMKYKCPAVMKCLSQEIGEDKYKEIISEFLEKYRYKNPSFEEFKYYAEEISGKNLDLFFYQWFETTDLPGYTIIKAESYSISTDKMETQYQMKVRVRNWEKGNGNIKVIFTTKEDRIVRDIPFESYEEKEIGVIVPNKPQYVMIDPIFSKNWSNLISVYDVPAKPMNVIPFEGVKTVKSEKSNEIIVDDQDEGFSIVAQKSDRMRIFRKKENESNIRESMNGVFNALFTRLNFNFWMRYYPAKSYGKYRNSIVVKNKGKGKSYASWKTLIPENGIYDTYIFIGNYILIAGPFGERLGSLFYITVISGGEENEIEIKTSKNMYGWHYLGEFEYNKGDTAEIRLSDKCDGAVIADAAKWVPAD